MKKSPILFLLFIFFSQLFLLDYTNECAAQEKSPVFKSYRPPAPRPLSKGYDETGERLWEGFQLIQKANSGDVVAQNELGIRYLLGHGISADTIKAVYWMQKAAEQKYMLAEYNMGIFLNNGLGVDWNPFEAFQFFRRAADKNMNEALYVVGLFYTDNLVVPRNFERARFYITRAAEAKYAPAIEVLNELDKKQLGLRSDSMHTTTTQKESAAKAIQWQPLFVDFNNEGEIQHSSEDELSFDSVMHNTAAVRKALGMNSINTDSLSGLALVQFAAEAGSPEALTLLGRWYEKGIGVKKDVLLASIYYIRAIRLDSQRAIELLWNLSQEKNILTQFQTRAAKNNSDAMFTLSALYSVGMYPNITELQALEFLSRGANMHHIQSLVEVGQCYYTGRWVKKDIPKAISYWQQAAIAGNREASIRVASVLLFSTVTGTTDSTTQRIAQLTKALNDGSVLAQVALALCYEKGIGVAKKMSEALRLYRTSAQRGNQTAYYTLRRLYDEQRPKDKEFEITE